MDNIEKINNYNYHHKNVKLIEHSITLLQNNIKESYINEYNIDRLAMEDSLKFIRKSECIKNRDAYVKLLIGIVASWSEELLKRLLYEKDGFKNEQIKYIHLLKDARQRWLTIFKVSFCNPFYIYNVGDPLFSAITDPEKEKNIKKSARLKYGEVKTLIEEEIFPIIDLRNKVQHGEWLYAFEPPNSINHSSELTGLIRRENIRSIQTKIKDITTIYKMIKDVVTYNNKEFTLDKKSTPFEHFFDINCHSIEHNKENLYYLNEKVYRQKIVDNYVRGERWRLKN
jgi:hypothetical protein